MSYSKKKHNKHYKGSKKRKHRYAKRRHTKIYRKKNSATKKRFNYKKNMRGGIALFDSNSNNNIQAVPIGNGKFSQSSYHNSDTPSGPPSAVSYIPAPVMDLKWSVGSGLQNFFNELFGQPKQYSSSPTDQPIADKTEPIIPTPLTNDDLYSFKQSIIDKYS